ncbi:polyhydroxyalkanoate synthesis repressor PhaR [Leptothrix discophora]|uniref:Polyhydroxyalkanoate synthesis repressor PhaR n=1 Tax=Leptothrix discophora TaxID=89 RepID=A0ABT9FZ77_LEPDI|nr:polyhydroxyalkanoate synthesis repressor PhaR [Leptothrix discophora]MDP4299540.1 polyhydroxyalkanoate synthesis repressor PhaR [Leptothrix discophora]
MPATRRTDATENGQDAGLRVLKKYPNRRLYDTQTSSYITLADVKQMVLDAEHFEVRDAKSGEEITRSILLQIILEEETAGVPMFSTQMLAQIIRFYGHTMQGLMGAYLEKNLMVFIDLQKRYAEQTGGLYEGQPFNADAWSQFMSMQAPVMQGFMSSYLDQSKSLFAQMQEQMQKQAGTFFPGMPGLGKTGKE